jgi:hypothetical protein
MAFSKITSEQLAGKGNVGQADTPGLSTAAMQALLDELPNYIVERFNSLIDELSETSASEGLGATVPTGLEAEANIQSIIAALYVILCECYDAKHVHFNKEYLDYITETMLNDLVNLSDVFGDIAGVVETVVDDNTKLPTSGAIVAYVQEMGGGDMMKARYDDNNDGVVNDSDKFGGNLPEHYSTKQEMWNASLGMIARTTVFNADDSITETGDFGTKTTVFNADGSITETLINGDITIVKTTTFNPDDSITETIQ